jgi:hypothetical protein
LQPSWSWIVNTQLVEYNKERKTIYDHYRPDSYLYSFTVGYIWKRLKQRKADWYISDRIINCFLFYRSLKKRVKRFTNERLQTTSWNVLLRVRLQNSWPRPLQFNTWLQRNGSFARQKKNQRR